MDIVILNDDVLLTSLAPFLNVPDFVRLASACRKLRNMFLPLAFKTLSSDEITFSRFLNIFRDHPAALSQVRELVVTDHAASVSDVTTEIIQLVGSGLDRLTLFDRDKYEEEGLNQIFLEWVRLCPNVRTLDFNISNLSRRWWLSGGASSMAIAISELVHLEGLEVYTEFPEDDDFWRTALGAIKPGRLKRNLSILSHSSTKDFASLISRQAAVKRLDLLLHKSPTADDVARETKPWFQDFSRLERATATVTAFLLLAPSLPYCANLRHLTIRIPSFNDYVVETKLRNAVTNGSFNRLETLHIFAQSCSGYLECTLFHLLGSPASLKEFAIRCTNLRPPLETETLDLNKVLSNLIPTSHLTSLDIYLNVADATILEFAKFVSRCPSLRTFRMASTRENVMAEEDDQNKFLSLVSSAGNLKDVSLPYTLRSNGLVSIDRILCNGHPQFLKALDLRVGKDIDTLSGAHLLLRAPYVLESLNLDMFDVKEEIGKHISSLLHIVIVQEPRNLIRLCFSKIWLPDSEERIIQEVRSCLAVVERLASTSDRLRTIHFDAWNFGLSEKHLFEKVEEVRRLNGLRPVEIISSSTAYEMGASGFQDRSWRRKVGWRPIDALQRSNVTGEWILFPDEYYDGSMLKFGWNKAKMP